MHKKLNPRSPRYHLHMGRGKRGSGVGGRVAVSEQMALAQSVINEQPELSGRQARCSSCKTLIPSSPKLPLFEFRGEGSKAATETCAHCHYGLIAHTSKIAGRRVDSKVCYDFEPIGAWEYDLYYCGCRGWD